MVHEDLAKEVIPSSGCYSVVGPTEEIYFSDAAIFWSSVYHLLFSENSKAIGHSALKSILQKACKLFEVKIAYYSKSKKLERGYTKDILKK